jgi:hypothetical protein
MIIDQEFLQYANEMYRQLGGKTFKLMTGALVHPLVNIEVNNGRKSLVSLFIALPAKNPQDFIFNKNKIIVVFMHLMCDDTYTFEFIRKGDNTPFKTIQNVYCDEVQDIFELNTGLLVTPHNRKNSQVVVGINA